ncbi:MAG: UDP-3-O-acyl-N-acetylglucosamine deacetylase [Acidobacteriota bacterium]|nr:UDP-3-O-acyl-N-acetylglucosamine deacetylase [Acidobacteriota bacterium]
MVRCGNGCCEIPPTVAFLPQPGLAPSTVTCYTQQETQHLAAAPHYERTIDSELEFVGVGLHSGAPVTMRLVPAPAGSGIVFRRTDLDNFEIPATGRNVAKVSYATSLMRGSVLISTTEHLLSALIGYGVDNVIVEVDNLEVPILDGSALPYVQAIVACGVRQQRRKREYLRILKEVEVREGDKFIGVYPGPGYSIDYSIDFPAPIGHGRFVGDLATGDYVEHIAPARTFGFKEDEAKLRNMGLIRGVSDACAIIVSAQGVENGPLRFADEFVRHKVLDLIGDLALAGRRIQGRVVAERAGHAMHTALVQRLLRDRSAWELAHGYDEEPEAQPSSANAMTHLAAVPANA